MGLAIFLIWQLIWFICGMGLLLFFLAVAFLDYIIVNPGTLEMIWADLKEWAKAKTRP